MVGGSGDQNGAKEREFNRLTFSNNIWENLGRVAIKSREALILRWATAYR